jgi:hypothetical protein
MADGVDEEVELKTRREGKFIIRRWEINSPLFSQMNWERL